MQMIEQEDSDLSPHPSLDATLQLIEEVEDADSMFPGPSSRTEPRAKKRKKSKQYGLGRILAEQLRKAQAQNKFWVVEKIDKNGQIKLTDDEQLLIAGESATAWGVSIVSTNEPNVVLAVNAQDAPRPGMSVIMKKASGIVMDDDTKKVIIGPNFIKR